MSTGATAEPLSIAVGDSEHVAGLLQVPAVARACFVMAHGAGAGMTHPFMAAVADGLYARRVATLRYQFPYMERGSKRPDPPHLAHATVRAAVTTASQRLPGMALYAGGRSFGGRMTSQAQARAPLTGVRGLAFFAFPLHPAGQPSDQRGEHLTAVQIPMLFMQGTRDALADLALLQALVAGLGSRATLQLVRDADHSFHVPAKSRRKDADVLDELLDGFESWIGRDTAIVDIPR